MDVKEAAKTAKEYVTDLFAEERITNVGLEEIERKPHEQVWEVTVGFSRPWDHAGLATVIVGQTGLRRSYKLLRINDTTGNVESVKDRILREST